LEQKIELSKHEEELAYGAVHPDDINTCLSDVGGHEEAISRLLQITNLLLNDAPSLLNSRTFTAPTGILLYGPPGCGKTMIARALAKESGVRFLSLNLSTILDKWLGETEKYVDALFTLAGKIGPVIIFIDEIDALTRKRGGTMDRDYSTSMKSQLLINWDGIVSTKGRKTVIMGATNRPQDIDRAFLRRMPLQVKIGLPDERQRTRILGILLDDIHPVIDVDNVARETEGFSGSDLHELVRRTVLEASLCSSSIDDRAIEEELVRMRKEMQDCLQYDMLSAF